MNKDKPFIISIIQDLANVTSLVRSFYKDEKKAVQWLNSSNPLLEGKTPTDLVFEGNTEELIHFIERQFKDEKL